MSKPITIRLGGISVLLGFALTSSLLGQTPQEKLDAKLRDLEKEIAAVRGLQFKAPVQAKIIPREAGNPKERQGYYDPKSKTLFLYDDLADNYQKGVLIHEMVHAMQDQHFDLTKLKAALDKEHYKGDADLALAALIEGDATFTMIEVLKKEQPKAAAMLDVPLEKAKNFQNAFLYAQGARYVKSLKDKGGWASVNGAYRFPPRTTGPILNLASVPSINLGKGESQGAFALFQQLAKNPKTRDDSLKLAQGYRGDRTVTSPEGTTTIYACKDTDHAGALGQAIKSLQQDTGRVFDIVVRGPRLFVYDAANAAALSKLRDRAEGPLNVQVLDAKTKEIIPFGVMIDKLLEADFVCVGETHDSEPHHRAQLQIIKGLYAQDDRLGVGMEMFQRPFQKALDRYGKNENKEDEFLKESEYQARWGYDWSLYRPIIEFCRRNDIPMAALNARKELTGRIRQVAIEKLKEEERSELGPIDIHVKEHRDHWYERLAKMHGNAKATEEQKERGYQIMAVWDDYMARSAADFLKERNLRRMVVLAGSGHIERGFGIPDRAARYYGGKSLTVGIALEGTNQEKGAVLTDFVVLVK
ncbi:MAG: ChaN family lipoprotein [Planctomycetes bacterium]|nr:ChaN family lipoprotein [Planctomycetota bacterium]